LQKRQTGLRPGPDPVQHFFQFFSPTLSQGRTESCSTLVAPEGCLNLSRLPAKTKTKRVLIRELLYADDAALVAHSEVHLQNLCKRITKDCTDFSMTTNLKKTVVMSLGTPIPPRILVNGSLLTAKIVPFSSGDEA